MILLVGESANRSMTNGEYSSVQLMTVGSSLWARWLLSLGAFANGCRYSDMGMRWDASLNLLPPGAEWDKGAAQMTANAVMRYIRPSLVLLAGRRVSSAFGASGGRLPSLTSTVAGSLLCLPHPSGRCRCWNDLETARKCAELWREAQAEVGLRSLEKLRDLQ